MIALACLVFVSHAAASLEFVNSWGGQWTKQLRAFQPDVVDFGPDGDAYVADYEGKRVIHLTADGDYVGEFDTSDPALPDYKTNPGALAVDDAGTIHVVDRFNGTITSYSPSGTVLGKWHPALPDYADITSLVFESGSFYLLYGNLIVRLSDTGAELNRWSFDSRPGFARSHIAGDGDGHVLVTAVGLVGDEGTKSIFKFNPDGSLVSDWTTSAVVSRYPIEHGTGTYISSISGYYGVAPTGDGGVWVTNAYEGSPHQMVSRLSATGDIVGGWGSAYANQLSLAPDGKLWLPLSEFQPALGVFDTDGNQLNHINAKSLPDLSTDTGDGLFAGIDGLSIASDGRVFALDGRNGRVQRFSAAGEFQKSFNGEFDYIGLTNVLGRDDGDMAFFNDLQNKGVVFDGDGNETHRWELDTGTRTLWDTIQVGDDEYATLSGTPVTVDRWGTDGQRLGSWWTGLFESGDHAIARNGFGNLLILDGRQVEEFTLQGALVNKIKLVAPSPEIGIPVDIAVGPNDHIFILLFRSGRSSVVVELSRAGREISRTEITSNAPDEVFDHLAVSPLGYLYAGSPIHIRRYRPVPTPFRADRVKYNPSRRAASIDFYVPGPGSVEITGDQRVRKTSRDSSGESFVTLPVRALPRFMKPVRKKSRVPLRLAVKATFSAEGSQPVSVATRVTLKRHLKKTR